MRTITLTCLMAASMISVVGCKKQAPVRTARPPARTKYTATAQHLPSLERASGAFDEAVAAMQRGNAQDALEGFSAAVAMYGMIPGADRQRATCYGNMGVMLAQMRRYEEAIAKQEKALSIYRTIDGAEEDEADCYMNIAATLGSMGWKEEKVAKLQHALSIYKTIPGTEKKQAFCYLGIGAGNK